VQWHVLVSTALLVFSHREDECLCVEASLVTATHLECKKRSSGSDKKKSKKFLLAQSLALVMSKCLEQTSIHDNSSSGIQNAMLFIIVSGFSVTN